MTKAPTPIEKSKKHRDNTKRHQNFDYTTIADRLRKLRLVCKRAKVANALQVVPTAVLVRVQC